MATPSNSRAPPVPPSTPTSRATLPSVRLSLCVPPSTPSKSSPSTTAPSTSHPPPPVHQGFISRRSHGRFWQKKEWSHPWIILDRASRQLRLYSDSEVLRHPELKPRKVYGLQGLEVMVKENQNKAEDDYEGKARWSFDLILKEPSKKMELGCPSKEERQRWLDALDVFRAEEAEKENRPKGKANPNGPTAVTSTPASASASSLMSPPRPPKKPAMTTPSLPATPLPPTPAGVKADSLPADEEKRQLTASPTPLAATPASASAPTSYLSKAIAAGTAVPMMVGRPAPPAPAALPPTAEVKSEEKRGAPALPASTPKTAAGRTLPAQSPPPPPPTPVVVTPSPAAPVPAVAAPAPVPATVPTAAPAPVQAPAPAPIAAPVAVPVAAPVPAPAPKSATAPATPPRRAAAVAPESPYSPAEPLSPVSPVSPPAPRMSDATAALASALIAHHASLMESVMAVGSLAWNEEYQTLLHKARSSASVNSGVVYAAHLHTLLTQFRARCVYWARRIIEEYLLPVAVKTVKPVREVAEREKMVYLVEGIGFAFAQAGEEDEEEYLHATESADPSSPSSAPEMSISAARLADQLAYKHATHELHAVKAMQGVAGTLPAGLCLPLILTVDYLGFRLKCTATLPIYDEGALVWGKDQQGAVRQTEATTALLSDVAAALNLAPYSSTSLIPLSSSVALYTAGARHYITGLGGVYPVDLDVKYASAHHRLEVSWQAKVFRREFLSHYHVRLSSDVYGGVERRMREDPPQASSDDEMEEEREDALTDDEEEKEAKAAEASKFLQETIIPRFIRQLEKLTGGQYVDIPTTLPSPPSTSVYPATGCAYFLSLVDGLDLCHQLHSHGINLRYLGRIAELTKQPFIRLLCAVEMIARTCKTLLAQNLRTLQRTVVSTETDASSPSPLPPASTLLLQHSLLTRLQDGAVDFLNLVLGRGDDSDQFWSLLLYPDICIKYALPPSTPLTLAYLRSVHLPLLLATLLPRCSLSVVDRVYSFGGERPIEASDFIAFTTHVKEAPPVLAADGYVGKARAALVGGGEGVEGKDWRRFTGGMEIWLTMRGWKTATPGPAAAPLELREGRRRLRALNELIYAYLQAGDADKAQGYIQMAATMAASLAYPPSFASLPPALTPSPPRPTSFGPNAEHARLSILRMWHLMVAPGTAGVGELKGVKRQVTEEYQAAVSHLNYHVSLLHPLMLSLHYALAHYHLLVQGTGVAGGPSPAVSLLTHCHQFALALFSARKPMSWGLASLLGERCEKEGQEGTGMAWTLKAIDGMDRWMDSRSVGEAERARVKEGRDRLQERVEQLTRAGEAAKRESEEKQQTSVERHDRHGMQL